MFYRRAIGLLRRIRVPAQTTVAANRHTNAANASSAPKPRGISCQYGSEFSTWNKKPRGISLWILVYSQAAIFLGMNATTVYADEAPLETVGSDVEEASFSDLRRIEDGSVVSNIHTSKWRVFTDNGRNLSSQGKLAEAERYFVLALQEAKEGFGEKDPHVASSCNNLAELYRVQKAFGKAEPYYLEAVRILEESYGPDDVRVGAALHNLGQFYLVQRKLEQARVSYERALKIKKRVLGHAHSDYADTMYHLGTVLYLEGNESDSVTLIESSIKILEEGGLSESPTCLRRLKHLSQIHLKSKRLAEAENIQRKILHVMELSKGWNSSETVIAAERLALTLQSMGSLQEAGELLQQCLDTRKSLLPENHIQIGANMLYIADVILDKSNQSEKVDLSELDRASALINSSITIISHFYRQTQKKRNVKEEHAALVLLLQAFVNQGKLEIRKQELQKRGVDGSSITKAEHAFRQCISTFREAAESESGRLICNAPDVKAKYLSCLKHLASLISGSTDGGAQNSRRVDLQELNDEIKSVEADLARHKRI